MAIENFKQTFWSRYIQTELDKEAILADFTNKNFEGECKHGNAVKILGVGNPTIVNYTGSPLTAEAVKDTSVTMLIDQAKAFYIYIDDVDKAQSKQGGFEAYMKQATKGLTYEREKHVAAQAVNAGKASESLKISTAAEAKSAIDAGVLWLRENDVKVTDDVAIELCPFVYQLMKDKYIELDTRNSEMLAKGIVGYYDGYKVRASNLLYNDGTDVYCMIRTKEAIAFASQIEKVEAERPNGVFQDAVKGLSVYGAKVVRPKELYVIKAHK